MRKFLAALALISLIAIPQLTQSAAAAQRNTLSMADSLPAGNLALRPAVVRRHDVDFQFYDAAGIDARHGPPRWLPSVPGSNPGGEDNMNAARVFGLISLIPDRTARLSSGTLFSDAQAATCKYPERVAHLCRHRDLFDTALEHDRAGFLSVSRNSHERRRHQYEADN